MKLGCKPQFSLSVFLKEVFFCPERKYGWFRLVQILFIHIYLGYSCVVICMIVIDAFGGVDAGCIYSDFIVVVSIDYSSSLLVYRSKDMEKL